MTEPSSRIPKRGFASMDKQKRREIARLGGRAAHKRGTAHQFSSEEARKAGRKGGTSVSHNREYMSLIGRRGAEVRHSPRKRRKDSDDTAP
ncbi:MAG TPA: KGG domain-containing protein [Rudaea sp.]